MSTCVGKTTRRALVVAAGALCIILAGPAAADWEVSTYEELLDAVDNAEDGDTIRVEAGTLTWTTRLDIEADDLTLSGGWNSDFSSQDLGATIITGATPGGMSVLRSFEVSFTIEGFTFENNDVDQMFFRGGGSTDQEHLFRNNIIRNNSADRMFILNQDPQTTLENNIFDNNAAGKMLVRGDGGDIVAVNNTFYGDDSGGDDMLYGRTGGASVIATNNIFVSNVGGSPAAASGDVSASYNLFYDNTWDDEDAGGLGDDNLVENPLFVDAAQGDFRLQPGSPAIGAADDEGILGARGLPGTGIDGVDAAPAPNVFVAPGGDTELGPVLIHEDFEDEVEFQWYFEGDPLEGEIDAGLLLDDVTEDDAGTYTVVVSHDDFEEEFEIELSIREVHAPAAGLAGLTAAGGAMALMGLARIRRKR